jgi:hypothetical protein
MSHRSGQCQSHPDRATKGGDQWRGKGTTTQAKSSEHCMFFEGGHYPPLPNSIVEIVDIVVLPKVVSCALVLRRLERVDAVGDRALFDGWRGAVLVVSDTVYHSSSIFSCYSTFLLCYSTTLLQSR